MRIDSHIYQGYTVPPYYDSLLAKIITVGSNRAQSIARMRRVLEEITIEGVATTVSFHRALLQESDFIAGRFDTDFVSRTDLGQTAAV